MARLRHHAQGPENTPRQRRSRRSQHSQSQPQSLPTPQSSQSQTAPAPGSKRAGSPSGNVAHPKRHKRAVSNDEEQLLQEMTESTQRMQSSEAVIVEHEEEQVEQTNSTVRVEVHKMMIEQEEHVIEEESVVQTEQSDIVAVENKTRRIQARHSDPGVLLHNDSLDDGSEEECESSPALAPVEIPTGLSPYLRRIGEFISAPVKGRNGRQSLPARLPNNDHGGTEIQFIPLRAVLDGRSLRRLRRRNISETMNDMKEQDKQEDVTSKLREQIAALEKEKKELEHNLEAQRMSNIHIDDDEVREAETAIEEDAREINELSMLAGQNLSDEQIADLSQYIPSQDVPSGHDTSVLDDDEVTLVDPTNTEIAATPASKVAKVFGATVAGSQARFDADKMSSQWAVNDTQGEAASQAHFPDRISDRAVANFRSQITDITHELANAQAAIRLISLELDNLKVTEDGASAETIITTLRHIFEDAREDYDNIFGPDAAVSLSNRELVPKLVDHVRNLLDKLKALMISNEEQKRVFEVSLAGMASLVADADKTINQLEHAAHHWQSQAEEQLSLHTSFKEKYETSLTQIESSNETIERLQEGNTLIADRLAESENARAHLEERAAGFRRELKNFHESLINTQRESRRQLAEAQRDRIAEVTDLVEQLEEEQKKRNEIQEEAVASAEALEDLEHRLEAAHEQLQQLGQDADKVRALLAEETASREAIETECDSQAAHIVEIEEALKLRDQQIATLHEDLQTIQKNLDAERSQREAAETDLDQRNNEYAELVERNRELGIQANQLRSKIFELQQEHKTQVSELKEELEAEVQAHQETAETEKMRHDEMAAEIASLQESLEEVNRKLDETVVSLQKVVKERDAMVAERDERIHALNSTLDDLEQKHSELSQSSAMEISNLEASITGLNQVAAERQAKIEELEANAVANTQSFHDELEERDGVIGALQGELKTSQSRQEQLEGKVLSLEGRITNEAHELLIQNARHVEEVEGLKATINSQASTIAKLQADAEQRAADHSAALRIKTEELEEVKVVAQIRGEDIVSLEKQIEELKELFRVQEEETRLTIESLQESQRMMIAQSENLSAGLLKKQQDTLKAVSEMKTKGVTIKTTGLQLHKVSKGRVSKMNDKVKVTKKVNKKRVHDSGIGLADGDDEDVGEEMNGDEAIAI